MYGLAGLVLAVVYDREVCYPLTCSQYILTVLSEADLWFLVPWARFPDCAPPLNDLCCICQCH